MPRILLTLTLFLTGCETVTPVSESRPRVQAHTLETATYRVEKGDTLFSIARSHGTTLAALERLNPKVDPGDLEVGMTLRVPGGKPDFRKVER